MIRKKKFIIACSFLVCILEVCAIKVNAYEITEVSYIWNYLEKNIFFIHVFRNIGWFIYVIVGAFLNFCYDTFTAAAEIDILNIPIVGQIIRILDTLLPYIVIISVSVILVMRLFNSKNISKVVNMLVVTMLMAIFSYFAVLINDMKIAEAENVIGIDRISDTLLAKNTVDIKKSLDNGSVQYLDKNNVAVFKHNLPLSKDYLDKEIIDKNPDGTYHTVPLSYRFLEVGYIAYYYRYNTDYWTLNITAIVSVIIYVMAIFKMGYLLFQWLQENIFGRFRMKGAWDLRSVGKIFKSMLPTIFALIEIYFMMLFFSYFFANISSEAILDWLGKVTLIFAMGILIIAGSGLINDLLGIDDGSYFMIRSLLMGRKLPQAETAPVGMIGRKPCGNHKSRH